MLDTNSGRIVEVVLRSPEPMVRAPDGQSLSTSWPVWDSQEVVFDPDWEGIACAVTITRDTEPMVCLYAQRNLPRVHRLLIGSGSSFRF